MRYKLRTATLAFLTLLIISVSTWAKQVTQKTKTLVINGQTGQVDGHPGRWPRLRRPYSIGANRELVREL